MARSKGRQIVKALKEKSKTEEKTNITFRMPRQLIEEFKAACSKEGVSANSVAEELIKGFVSDVG
tara:strand:+ start:6224 stop:6418 length:195 start_codon:yes stop_codon:yes gene_type:complete